MKSGKKEAEDEKIRLCYRRLWERSNGVFFFFLVCSEVFVMKFLD